MTQLAPLLQVLRSTRPLRPLFRLLDELGVQNVGAERLDEQVQAWLAAHQPHDQVGRLPATGAGLVERAAKALAAMPSASFQGRRSLVRAAIHLTGLVGGARYAGPRAAVWTSERITFPHVLLERRGKVVWLIDAREDVLFAALRVHCAERLVAALPPRAWGRYPVAQGRAATVAVIVPCEDGILSTCDTTLRLPEVHRGARESWRAAAVRAASEVTHHVTEESEVRWHSRQLDRLVARVASTPRETKQDGADIVRFPPCHPDAEVAWRLFDAERARYQDAHVWADVRHDTLWVHHRHATRRYRWHEDEPAPETTLARVAKLADARELRRAMVYIARTPSARERWLATMRDAGIERLGIVEPSGSPSQGIAQHGAMSCCATWDPREAYEFVCREVPKAPPLDALTTEERTASVFSFVTTDDERTALATLLHALVRRDALAERALQNVDATLLEIDVRLSQQLDEIVHHPTNMSLEQIWRGLWHVVDLQAQRCPSARIELFNCSHDDLVMDFEDSPDIPKSGLYKVVYSSEYGSFGGRPFTAMFLDYTFDPSAQDVWLFNKVAEIAAFSMTPCVVGATDELLDLKPNAVVPQLRELVEREASRFLVAVGPRMLLRLPYDVRFANHGVRYREGEERHARHLLWGSAAWALAGRLLDSWGRFSWGAHIDGPAIGGCLDGVTAFERTTTKVECDAARRRGIALWRSEVTEKATIDRTPTVHCGADASEPAADRLANVLIVSRFGQYLKILQREQIGAYKTPPALQSYLSQWLNQHVSADRHPPQLLTAAEVEVSAVPGQHGIFGLRIRVTPRWWPDGQWLTLTGKLDRE